MITANKYFRSRFGHKMYKASISLDVTCPNRDGTLGSIDTENIYIEGDNLDALKLLQETYLGKVKMIYIDPPYNTGSDFVYKDDFSQGIDRYLGDSGQFDEEGNSLWKKAEEEWLKSR